MKGLLTLCLLFYCFFAAAQADSANGLRPVEPDQETSFENYELLIIAVVGLLLLMGLRFWFKRTRKR